MNRQQQAEKESPEVFPSLKANTSRFFLAKYFTATGP